MLSRSSAGWFSNLFRHAWRAVLLTALLPCSAMASEEEQLSRFIAVHCSDCHTGNDAESGVVLSAASLDDLANSSVTLERALKKIRARQMPPLGYPRPSDDEFQRAIKALEDKLDSHAALTPNPGRTDTFRRLTRTEYRNAIRDLLDLNIDVETLLPADASSHGFDNITVGDLSPTLMNRYVSAAQKVSRLAVGGIGNGPAGDTIRIKPDLTQETRMPGLPLGTRGGALIKYTFPRTGEYDIELRLTRDRNEHVEGLNGPHEMQILLDRELLHSFVVRPPKDGNHSQVDRHLKARIAISAGAHDLGVTFVQNSASLQETMRQPLQSHFNVHRHPRQTPALYQVSITGPFDASASNVDRQPDDTPSRRRVFTSYPRMPDQEAGCATKIVQKLARLAFRRPVNSDDCQGALAFFEQTRADGGTFEQGMEAALSSILVSPNFLFRMERQPASVPPAQPYVISDLELASRLSFFLWSSIPDDRLLTLAENGTLRQAGNLEAEVCRMLADERASNLVTNFAAQWLYLSNLDAITPDARLYPDFDENLRHAFRMETEMLFEELVRSDSSVINLLKSDHTYLNERLAKHYQIPHVYGSHFRRVELPPESIRGGLLRQGSILTVTSYATRTSPVIRGHWILKNLLGSPPPPPPPNVPALEDNSVAADLPMREKLAVHRENEACAGCHAVMDPVGFALENFDAIGRWRDLDAGLQIDASGGLPSGAEFYGVDGLEQALLESPELFVSSVTEKLMTFALGRGVEPFDGPAVREVVRRASKNDYRFSSLVVGIVSSTPFQLRKAL